MKKVMILTDVDFWRQGAGHRTRILTLANYLVGRVCLYIVYIGKEEPGDRECLQGCGLGERFYVIAGGGVLTSSQQIESLEAFPFLSKIEVCILEYLHLSYFLKPLFERKIRIFLDTHDLQHEKEKSFNEFGQGPGRKSITEEEELSFFKFFTRVLLIQEADYRKVSDRWGAKALLTPHPVLIQSTALRIQVTAIGFVGSEYPPNADAIRWFLREVWPAYHQQFPEVVLHIFGRVCTGIQTGPDNGVVLHGFRENLEEVYAALDIVINPVRYGAGLKIKNVEALGKGLPLVTTGHGALGLGSAHSGAFLVADTAAEFHDHLQRLTVDPDYRKALGRKARLFAARHFSEKVCYEPVLTAINEA